MTTELENKLIEKYPHFFGYLKEYEGPIIPIQFGFECEDGWYTLLDTLMESITNHIEHAIEPKPIVNIHQIKEKFGGLCFYIGGASEYIHNIISFAEAFSYSICEECGTTKNVTQSQGGWVYTRCEDCMKKLNKDYATDNN